LSESFPLQFHWQDRSDARYFDEGADCDEELGQLNWQDRSSSADGAGPLGLDGFNWQGRISSAGGGGPLGLDKLNWQDRNDGAYDEGPEECFHWQNRGADASANHGGAPKAGAKKQKKNEDPPCRHSEASFCWQDRC
jgi:hypothetical protein